MPMVRRLLPAAALGWEAIKQRTLLTAIWVCLWFAVAFGLLGLAWRGTQFDSAPLLTVPAMLLAVALLLLPRSPRSFAVAPTPA